MAVGRKLKRRFVTMGLAVVMISLGYVSTTTQSYHIDFVAYMAGTLFFLDMIYLLSRSLLVEQTRVTGETLWGAINIYLLFGMMFAFLYSAVLALNPGAFEGGILENENQDIIRIQGFVIIESHGNHFIFTSHQRIGVHCPSISGTITGKTARQIG